MSEPKKHTPELRKLVSYWAKYQLGKVTKKEWEKNKGKLVEDWMDSEKPPVDTSGKQG